MPVHEAATTIEESIASVRAQSLEEWELILVDDGSTDDGMALAAAACAGAAQPVRFLGGGEPGRPRGPAWARNLALGAAEGELVAFLDADDTWDPDYLRIRHEAFCDDPSVALVWGPTLYWHPTQPEREDYVGGTGVVPEDRRRFAPNEVVRYWMWSLMRTPGPGATVVRRDVARGCGGFPEELKRGEDVALWMRIAVEHPVRWDARVLHRYRRHPGSSTATASRQGAAAAADLKFTEWTVHFIASHPGCDGLGLAVRNFHGQAQRVATTRPPGVAAWFITRTLWAEPAARRYLWWVLSDWFLPRTLARRAVPILYGWAGANTL